MGTGIADDILLKAIGGVGALGLFAYLSIVVLRWIGSTFKDIQSASAEKDKTFAVALDKLGADMKFVSGQMKDSIDSVKAAIVEMDRAHTSNNNQTFQLLISLNDKQGNVIGVVISKVDHLDQTVKQLADKQDEHGAKLDAITRAMPGVTAEMQSLARAAERTSDRIADRAMDRAAQIEGK